MENSKEKEIELVFKKWRRPIDSKIKEILNRSVDKETEKLVNYQVAAGGKRFRPVLTIISCLACGGKVKDVLYPAAGLEILHNCTLIYDDIIDNSLLRRGKPTVWFKFGKSIAECVGIDYSAAIFQAANKSMHPTEISEIFARTMKAVVDGEILDILFEYSGRKDEKYIIENRYNKITERDYLEMVSKKTASLIQACCETGAISAKAKKSERNGLKNYGFNLGLAFQIQDDILDIFGEEKEFGKKIGKDIEERKLGNIVIFYALK
ncbi:MAG: polyprenyl synthetase family protein, partial [Candidatus Nealsonbacteria bacterium]|nr:polyprenyl synthetase family protein [Candidatus Nealsonbacteria bacterium]